MVYLQETQELSKERNLVEEKQEEVLNSLRDNYKNQKKRGNLSLSILMKKVLISSCLLGKNVKYDGGNNSILENDFIQFLKEQNLLIPVCPEVDGGLTVPRVPVEILVNRAINRDGIDKTSEFTKGAELAVEQALNKDIKMAIMKSKSPSCGKDFIYDGSFTKTLIKKDGIAAGMLKKSNIKIFTENEIDDAYAFWKEL
jgi:uncharacterized protein YbbK (DUF523 family)